MSGRKMGPERRWALSQWERGGWSGPRIGFEAKKWQQHILMLVRDGYLEADEYGNYRITDAGLAALAEVAP